MPISQEVKAQILNSLTAKAPVTDAITGELDNAFLQYDSMQMYKKGPIFIIDFYWKGSIVNTIDVSANFSTGDTVNLINIEGRMPITVSTT